MIVWLVDLKIFISLLCSSGSKVHRFEVQKKEQARHTGRA